ncbi:MAG: hypothetical protein AMXMBFR84_06560 [Candidatus Hydrogenedentota bacterium]
MRSRFAGKIWVTNVLLTMVLALTAAGQNVEQADPGVKPNKAPDFLLIDQNGEAHQLSRYCADAKAIVIYSFSTKCDTSRADLPNLNALHQELGQQGVVFLFLDANKREKRGHVADIVADAGVALPILMDESQMVSRRLGFERNGEALVVEPKECGIVYRGAAAGLKAALEAVIAGKEVTSGEASNGTAIKYQPLPQEVSYVNDIVPIIENKCVSCHSPGNIGPFSFSSHRRVQTWGPMIEEVLMTQRMPPWHADEEVGAFSNARDLSAKETRTVLAWLDAGAPKDGDVDPLEAVEDMEMPAWSLGEPDLLVELPEDQVIPASGVFDYRYFGVPSGLTEDKWVRAVEVRTNNRQVTHHVLVFLSEPNRRENEDDDEDDDNDGGLEGFFAGYVPGFHPQVYPKDSGKFLPAGSRFVFQNHYTATGKEEHERTQMALYFHDTPPAREFVTRAANNIDFEILPGDYNSTTTAEFTVDRDATLHKLIPHMHLRGKWFKYEAEYPNGKRELLLSVPAYDFNWQHIYELQKPKKLPAGTVIHASGGFDNSVRNPNNPDPTTTVYFGDQTFDEMFIGYLDYSFDPDAPVKVDKEKEVIESIRTGIPITEENIVGTVWQSGRYKFTFNAEGKLQVNKGIRGRWWFDGQRVVMKVLGNEYDLLINGDQLTYDDGEPVPRIQ